MVVLPKTMKAWVVAKSGAPKEALAFRTDVPAPAAPRGADVLVRVTSTALNPADLSFMQGVPAWMPFRRSAVPGIDFAGEVVAAGPRAAAELATPGTRVAGAVASTAIAAGRGTLAQYIVVPASLMAPQPASLSPGQAAGLLGVVGQTVLLLVREVDLKEGVRVLVNGASGGVGSVLVQVAKARGATVLAVCSAANAEMVKRLGADDVIDYKAHESLPTYLETEFEKTPFDYIFDCVGDQDLFFRSAKYLTPKGKFLSIVASGGIMARQMLPNFMGGTPRTFKMIALFLTTTDGFAKEVSRWVEKGIVKEVPVDSEFPLDQAVQAYEKLLSKRAKGKIIINFTD